MSVSVMKCSFYGTFVIIKNNNNKKTGKGDGFTAVTDRAEVTELPALSRSELVTVNNDNL